MSIEEDLEEVRQMCEYCDKCSLCKSRTNIVFPEEFQIII